jgi:ABC-2 type transport system permease protein
MTSALLSITVRALLNRRRTLLLALVGVLLVVVAALFRLSAPGDDEADRFALRLLGNFGLGVVLPLVAVIVGTAALGSELDDGTIVYLLAKPVARWRIVAVKFLVTWLVTSLLVAPAVLVAGVVTNGDTTLALGFAVAALVGGLEYAAIFLALSLITSRALIIGLAYVVVWEGVVAGLFEATRGFSVRQHALAVANALGGDGASGVGELGIVFALAVTAVVTALAIGLAIRRLQVVELRGETA